MAKLNFAKSNNGSYVATAEISGATKLHVERRSEGRIFYIGHKSYPDDYMHYCTSTKTIARFIDIDLVFDIYPKYLQFVSEAEVEFAEIG